MKMISASRLRRAQDRIFGARPFARQMQRVLGSLAARVDPAAHPLLEAREFMRPGAPMLIVVITADRGLCGSFNANIIKTASSFIIDRRGQPVALDLVGRKGRDFFRRRGFAILNEHVNILANLRYSDAQAIAREAIETFTAREADSVHLVYNEFKSVLQQRVIVEQLLPIPRGEVEDTSVQIDYLYDPSPAEILNELLPRHVEVQVFRALLESAAAEHAARMTAMDSATKNSAEMIDRLTLYMNKVRQAAITREIIEVVSGAGAL
jgi:F-type H+-transporting ATPase subunit gamma